MKVNSYVAVFVVVGLLLAAAVVAGLVSGQFTVGTGNLSNDGPAPNFVGIAAWINSGPLNITSLRGKVVLVDFWTYSCINCIRTIPYLNAWYAKYASEGLVIVGVHTPEFSFEKNLTNVEAAVKAFGIKYPVALDSNDATWNAYNNQYWPADYLIDKSGNIRYETIGEGNYAATETAIQELLQNAGYNVSTGVVATTVNATSPNFSEIGTSEQYVGYTTSYEHGTLIGNAQGFSPGKVVDYSIGGSLQDNTVYFSGEWYNANDSMIAAGNDSRLFLIYDARNVNIVAQGNSSAITVTLDDKNLTQAYLGTDLTLSRGVATGTVGMARLYDLIDAPSYGVHEIEIIASPGFRLYTFTFG